MLDGADWLAVCLVSAFNIISFHFCITWMLNELSEIDFDRVNLLFNFIFFFLFKLGVRSLQKCVSNNLKKRLNIYNLILILFHFCSSIDWSKLN